MTPKQCIPMTPDLLQRIEDAFELPFVANAQALDLKEWCESNRTDLLNDLPLGSRAWQATTSDYWYTYIDSRMSDEDNAVICEIIDCLEDNPTPKQKDALQARWQEIERQYEPKPSERPDVWLPRHACHYFLRTQATLALTLWPEREWYAVANEDHTFVVDADGEVFDLLVDSYDPQYHHLDGAVEALGQKAQAA